MGPGLPTRNLWKRVSDRIGRRVDVGRPQPRQLQAFGAQLQLGWQWPIHPSLPSCRMSIDAWVAYPAMRTPPDDSPDLAKVTAFVTRSAKQGQELLVFEHPSAGIQLPAGTVEPGEPIESAALREVEEETGLSLCRVAARLGVLTQVLPDHQRIMLVTTGPRQAPDTTASHEGCRALRRGLTVVVRHRAPSWTQVFYRTHDFAHSPPRLISEFGGWVPAMVLGSRIQRHLVHLAFDGESPRRWERQADGHVFRPFWVPLGEPVELVAGQESWLAEARPALLRSARQAHRPDSS